MRQNIKTTVITYGILTFAGGFTFVLPDSVSGTVSTTREAPQEIRLTGTVHDLTAMDDALAIAPDSSPQRSIMAFGGLDSRHRSVRPR